VVSSCELEVDRTGRSLPVYIHVLVTLILQISMKLTRSVSTHDDLLAYQFLKYQREPKIQGYRLTSTTSSKVAMPNAP
jgi:hypothetical protein